VKKVVEAPKGGKKVDPPKKDAPKKVEESKKDVPKKDAGAG